jgi:hypothetical protein
MTLIPIWVLPIRSRNWTEISWKAETDLIPNVSSSIGTATPRLVEPSKNSSIQLPLATHRPSTCSTSNSPRCNTCKHTICHQFADLKQHRHRLHRDQPGALIPRWWRIFGPIFHDAPPDPMDLMNLPITWAEHATWRLGNANPASNSTMNDKPHTESTHQSSTTLDRFKDLRTHRITLDNSRTLLSLLIDN